MRILFCVLLNLFQIYPGICHAGMTEEAQNYPHLSNWEHPQKTLVHPETGETIERTRCPLKPEEAEWLEEQVKAGTLRPATDEEIASWEKKAKENEGQPPHLQTIRYNCGRTFTILKEITIPTRLKNDRNLSHYITFILKEDVPAPRNVKTLIAIYDLQNGGLTEGSECIIGNVHGIGNARNCPDTFNDSEEKERESANTFSQLSNWNEQTREITNPKTGNAEVKTRCELDAETAEWLETHIKEGKLRLATDADIEAWKQKAYETGQEKDIYFRDCGRTFVVLNKIIVPNRLGIVPFPRIISFIVPAHISFPEINVYSRFYDLESGGITQGRSCVVNGKQGYGKNPRNCEFENLGEGEKERESANTFPHLSNWQSPQKTLVHPETGETIERTRCALKPEEAEWLEEQVKAGTLRPATDEEIAAWEKKAKENEGQEINLIKFDCGRTFTIIAPLMISYKDFDGSTRTTFLVNESAPFPKIMGNGSAFYDLKTGGWFMMNHYAIGEEESDFIEHFPRYSPQFYGNKE